MKYILIHENGSRYDVTNEIDVYGSTITYQGVRYIYDNEEEVYWKNGIKFSSRIESI